MKNHFLFLIIIALTSCHNNKTVLNKIIENDNVEFPFSFVDIKSIEIYEYKDSVFFELKVKGLNDTIFYSDKSYYNFQINSKVNDSTEFILSPTSSPFDEDSIGKRTTVREYLLKRDIEISKIVRMPDKMYLVYPLGTLDVYINPNGIMVYKIKPLEDKENLINSLKMNILVSTDFYFQTPECNYINYTDYIRTDTIHSKYYKRGVDSSLCK